MEPVSPALTGRLLPTGASGKPLNSLLHNAETYIFPLCPVIFSPPLIFDVPLEYLTCCMILPVTKHYVVFHPTLLLFKIMSKSLFMSFFGYLVAILLHLV